MRAEVLRPDREHGRQADRRIHRVAAADPVPEPEHVGGVDAELRPPSRRWSRPRRSAWRRPSRRRPVPAATSARAVCALVIVSSVVKVFEETMNSVSAASRSRIASAKSVPSTLETKRNVMLAVAVVLQRLVGHHRPEVGAADADVDDVADALAGVALPLAAAHALGERRHLVEHGVDLGHDVLAVDHDRSRPRGARSATCSTARFSVTLILSPRNMASMRSRRPDSSASCEQQLERLVGDAVLRVVEGQAGRLDASGVRPRAGSLAKSSRRCRSRISR